MIHTVSTWTECLSIAIHHTYPLCHSTKAIVDHYGICWCLPTWGTATVNGLGRWGMHAPSRFPSLHRTPGPLSVPPLHLHLKGGRPRRLSLCSLPNSRNDLIYLFINGNICLFGAPSRLSRPQLIEMGEGAVKGETCDPPCDPRPNGPVTVLDSCDAGDFLSAPRLNVLRQSKGACVPEVSDSHVWWSMTGWLRSN